MSYITGPALKNSKWASTSSFIMILITIRGMPFIRAALPAWDQGAESKGGLESKVTLLLACYMKAKYPLMMQTAELSCCILQAKLTHTPLQLTSEVNAAALGSTNPNESNNPGVPHEPWAFQSSSSSSSLGKHL